MSGYGWGGSKSEQRFDREMIVTAILIFVSFSGRWPWYLAGPVIGLLVPALLISAVHGQRKAF
jgi:hypothetical protein